MTGFLAVRTPGTGRPWMAIIRLIGILIGITIMIILVRKVGWQSIAHTLGLLGWDYVIVLAYPLSWILLNTVGWRYCLRAQFAAVPLKRLALIRLAGEAFNSLLPFGYVGGEPVKAKLLSSWIPMSEAASSVLIVTTSKSVALALFIGAGLILGGRPGQLSAFRQPVEITALALLATGIALPILLLSRRSFSRVGRWLYELTGNSWLKKQESKLVALDESLEFFYRDGKSRFLASIVWHSGAFLAIAAEIAVIFFLIGRPITLREAWFISAISQIAVTVGLTPASVGLYEGSHFLAAQALGIPPSLGLSVALIRRVREIFWDGVGLWLFWKLSASTRTSRLGH